MEAAFKPEVKDELDTQNFEKFEEVYHEPVLLHLFTVVQWL
jgi:hypothetical protein